MTPTSTNLHFHGLTLPPVCHQDEVLKTSIQPEDPPFEYRFVVPAGEAPGLYWYHPHIHGFSSRQVTGGASGALIVEGLERAQIAEMLRDAILTLPDHYREPVTLCDLEGKSYGEAAALLDCPVGTVRSRLNRARSMLLDKLRPARIGSKANWSRPGEKT